MSRVSPKKIFEAIGRELPPPYEVRARSLLVGPASVIDIVADPIVVTVAQRGSCTVYPFAPINISLNMAGVADEIVVTVTMLGTWLNFNHAADPFVVVVTQHGDEVIGAIWTTSGLISVAVTIGSGGAYTVPVMITTPFKSNWLKWSNIGALDFTIWRDNVAGERPTDWKGYVWSIKKLGTKIVVYGQGGISLLTPVGNVFGFQTIYRLGIKNKLAITGTDSVHFFIDSESRLCKFESEIEVLDYSEYLVNLANPVVSLDVETGFVYMCDGTNGFVYNPIDKSLGSCPGNISGISSQVGTLYVVAPAAVPSPAAFEICTDIFDFGTRKAKVISGIELGVQSTKVLSVAVDYRTDMDEVFATSAWYTVDDTGKAYFPVYGIEFRIRVKAASYEYFTLDYISIKGNVNVTGERPLEWEDVYAIKRLGNNIVTYGDGGIIVLNMEDGLQTLHKMNLNGKHAVTGGEDVHYLLDIEGRLWSLDRELKLLDYSEYLSSLSNPTLSYDADSNLLYICDGVLGYVYSPATKSLGKGPENITGIGSQGGSLYVVAPATINIPVFEVCTDIYDLGSRKYKTISSIEVGTDETIDLWATIDFRLDRTLAFTTLAWRKVNPGGIVYLPCFGTEFRFRLKMLTNTYFELDYIKVNGVIHAYSYLDTFLGKQETV